MSLAGIGTIANVVSLVLVTAPKLIEDATALSTLFGNASDAVANAAPDGQVEPSQWAALRASVSGLRSELDAEVEADKAGSPPA